MNANPFEINGEQEFQWMDSKLISLSFFFIIVLKGADIESTKGNIFRASNVFFFFLIKGADIESIRGAETVVRILRLEIDPL